MHPKAIFSVLGFLLVAVGGLMLLAVVVSLLSGSNDAGILAVTSCLTIITGFALWLPLRAHTSELAVRDGFVIVSLGWVVASLFGCLPFFLSGAIPSWTDAYFETMSGFTTTGASIVANIEALPAGLLFWRSMTQWIGGLGIILLSVAILPLLGVGGMQLFQAEVPGVTVEKLTPRIGQTARILWFVYVLLTAAEITLLMVGGMSLFDATCHAFTTVSTGGFSTKNASIAHFNSPFIETVIMVFMFLAGTSFTLHYKALRGKLLSYRRDSEFVFYAGLVVAGTVLVLFGLPQAPGASVIGNIREAAFQVISIVTTTGYVTADYERWALVAQAILLVMMLVGACAGSTAGGIKIVRIQILLRTGWNQMKLLIHPRAVFPVRHNGRRVDTEIIVDVLAFFVLFMTVFVVALLVLIALGMDIMTALGAVAASMGNIGPGLGTVGPLDNYLHLSVAAKWVLTFCMLIGRLELFTVLVLFTPAFWRR